MAAEQKLIIQCTACQKKFHPAGFKVSRLGIRLKTCLECNARCKAERERSKCVHRKRKSDCLVCSPDKFCEHGERKTHYVCVMCNDRREAERERKKRSEFCTHGKQLCRSCFPNKFCEHGRVLRGRFKCYYCSGGSAKERKKPRASS